MKHLRRAGTTLVVAILSAGVVTLSAPGAHADDDADGASAAKTTKTSVVTARRDSGWH